VKENKDLFKEVKSRAREQMKKHYEREKDRELAQKLHLDELNAQRASNTFAKD